MTPQEYYSNLQELISASSKELAKQAIVPAANELLAEIKNRIQRDGKNSSGSDIGNYSTKQAYFGREAFDKKSSFKPPAGKKTMKLPQGYKELRSIQGKPVDKVNETYTGSTMAAYQLQAKETEVVIGFTTEKSSLIRKGQEAKKGEIFTATPIELADYNKNVVTAARELTMQLLR